MSSEKYWSEEYWQRYLSGVEGEQVDFLQDLWLDKYKELFGRIPRGRALDLGCGLGQFSQYLVASGFDVIASDISKAVLDQLQKRVPAIQTAHFDMAKPSIILRRIRPQKFCRRFSEFLCQMAIL